jgi:hypothetical protein
MMTKSKKEGGLGFKGMYGFNLAMLARQAWRMLISLESLCGQVLEAKFFPYTYILEATTMSEIWYTWRSTFKGVEDC